MKYKDEEVIAIYEEGIMFSRSKTLLPFAVANDGKVCEFTLWLKYIFNQLQNIRVGWHALRRNCQLLQYIYKDSH